MCHFITATLPRRADVARLTEIAEQHRRALKPLRNAHVEGQLESDLQYHLTTIGHCDCGTELGSARRVRDRSQKIGRPEQFAKLRRRGWSASKIERWLEQKTSRSAQVKRASSDTPDAGEWCLFIREVLASPYTDSFGLLLHWYGGALDSERIELRGREVILARDIEATDLLDLTEDVLYEFRK
jgi:hypothetical protein